MTDIIPPELGAPEESQQTWKSDVSKGLVDLKERVKANEEEIEKLSEIEEEEQERPTRLITTYDPSENLTPFTDDYEIAQVFLRLNLTGDGQVNVFIRDDSAANNILTSRGFTVSSSNEREATLELSLLKSSFGEASLNSLVTVSSGDANATRLGWTVIQFRSVEDGNS